MDGRISNFSQVASVRRYVFTDGRERGYNVIDCDNGKIRFLLNLDRALDVMQMYYKGENVSFVSKNGFVKENYSFVKRFEGGMVYTCGLDNIGGREGYELHGSFHMTPAELVNVKCDSEGIVIEGRVRTSALFGSNLVLYRKIFTSIGSEKVTIEDVITNESATYDNYCLLYHINIGYPMLDESCFVDADVLTVTPRTESAEREEGGMRQTHMPVPGAEESCYYLELKKPQISLYNRNKKRRFTLNYSAHTLPKFVEWKSMASGDYALAFEPATTELDGGFERKPIAPNESVSFSITLQVKDE